MPAIMSNSASKPPNGIVILGAGTRYVSRADANSKTSIRIGGGKSMGGGLIG